MERADSVARAPSNVARWVAATLCLVYGFAKINGSQFTVIDSELARPLGEVSGFWLTWRFFGYSAVYGTFIALVQIAGAIGLIVPRTALAAALVLLPLAINIVLVDIFYGVDLGGLLAAILLVLCLSSIVLPHARRLWSLVAPPALPRAAVRSLDRNPGGTHRRRLLVHLVGRPLQQSRAHRDRRRLDRGRRAG